MEGTSLPSLNVDVQPSTQAPNTPERHGVQHGNPDRPGFRSQHEPGGPEVGHGLGFGADLFALYRAGRVDLPALGTKFSEWTGHVHDAAQRVAFLSDSVGGEYALSITDQVRADLHHALRYTAVSMRDVGEALVRIAADYAATDAAASAEFNRLLGRHQELFLEPTMTVPPPPSSSDPYDEQYVGPSLEAPEPPPFFLTELLGSGADEAKEGLGEAVDGVGGVVDGVVDGIAEGLGLGTDDHVDDEVSPR